MKPQSQATPPSDAVQQQLAHTHSLYEKDSAIPRFRKLIIKMKTTLIAIALSASALAAQAASPLEQVYVGGNIGLTNSNFKEAHTQDDFSVGALVGYQVTRQVAAEVAYTRLANHADVIEGESANLNALTFSAKMDVPCLKSVGGFVKAGAAFTKVGHIDYVQAWTPAVGIGAEFPLASDLKVRTELNYLHDVGGLDAHVMNANVGLVYKF